MDVFSKSLPAQYLAELNPRLDSTVALTCQFAELDRFFIGRARGRVGGREKGAVACWFGRWFCWFVRSVGLSVYRSWSWSRICLLLSGCLPLVIDRQSELIVYHLVIVQSAYRAAAGTGVTVAELVVRKGETVSFKDAFESAD